MYLLPLISDTILTTLAIISYLKAVNKLQDTGIEVEE